MRPAQPGPLGHAAFYGRLMLKGFLVQSLQHQMALNTVSPAHSVDIEKVLPTSPAIAGSTALDSPLTVTATPRSDQNSLWVSVGETLLLHWPLDRFDHENLQDEASIQA